MAPDAAPAGLLDELLDAQLSLSDIAASRGMALEDLVAVVDDHADLLAAAERVASDRARAIAAQSRPAAVQAQHIILAGCLEDQAANIAPALRLRSRELAARCANAILRASAPAHSKSRTQPRTPQCAASVEQRSDSVASVPATTEAPAPDDKHSRGAALAPDIAPASCDVQPRPSHNSLADPQAEPEGDRPAIQVAGSDASPATPHLASRAPGSDEQSRAAQEAPATQHAHPVDCPHAPPPGQAVPSFDPSGRSDLDPPRVDLSAHRSD